MEHIKFHIKRTGWGVAFFLFLDVLVPLIFILIALSFVFEKNSLIVPIIVIVSILPFSIFMWRRNTVTVTGDQMIVRFGIGYFHIVVDISTVSNVHYKQKREKIYGAYRRSMKLPFQNSKELRCSGLNMPFQKRKETVCFISARGNHYYLAVKEHEKLYELLKKREVYPEAE